MCLLTPCQSATTATSSARLARVSSSLLGAGLAAVVARAVEQEMCSVGVSTFTPICSTRFKSTLVSTQWCLGLPACCGRSAVSWRGRGLAAPPPAWRRPEPRPTPRTSHTRPTVLHTPSCRHTQTCTRCLVIFTPTCLHMITLSSTFPQRDVRPAPQHGEGVAGEGVAPAARAAACRHARQLAVPRVHGRGAQQPRTRRHQVGGARPVHQSGVR